MQAILALEDGRVFRGKGYGAKGECLLWCDPDDETQFLTFIVPGEFPTTGGWNGNSRHHKGVRRPRSVAVSDEGWGSGICPFSDNDQARVRLRPPVIAFAVPRQLLSIARLLVQSMPFSVGIQFGPEFRCTEPKSSVVRVFGIG